MAGWSATNLHWEGVAFETFYRMIIAPSVPPDTSVTHVVFGGLDGYRSVMSIEDALAEDVLIAERLDGRPLDGDHGAPARLVSPSQYGFVSTKHLCRIELHTAEPSENYHPSPIIDVGLRLLKPYPRARVWEEERHRYLPAWSLRHFYRLLIPAVAFLCARGSGRSRTPLEDALRSTTEVSSVWSELAHCVRQNEGEATQTDVRPDSTTDEPTVDDTPKGLPCPPGLTNVAYGRGCRSER